MAEYVALDLTGTIHHDGHGGVADDLTDAAALTTWVRDRVQTLGGWADSFDADDASLAQMISTRTAIRRLLAHAVGREPSSFGPSSPATSVPESLDLVNKAAAQVTVAPRLVWHAPEQPRQSTHAGTAAAPDLLVATIARSAIDLLSGPHYGDLRACNGPHCVRYFIKSHGRQEFCKPSCGNRARVARHYQRHKGTDEGSASSP